MMNRSAAPLMALIGILCVVGVITSFFAFNVMMDLKGGDPYDHADSYDLAGTCSGYAVSGTAECRTYNESDAEHFYGFTYHITYNADSVMELESTLFCDIDGTPISMYERLPDTVGDHILWRYSSRGITYTYEIGDHCRVYSISLASAELDVKAEIIG